MAISTTFSSGEILSSLARHSYVIPATGMPQSMPPRMNHMPISSAHVMANAHQKRSPFLCGYPSKKCWSWRVEKRNGELHKFCEYHRQKANTNQRRMEQRRKNGHAAPTRAKGSGGSRRSHKVMGDVKQEVIIKADHSAAIPKSITHPKAVDISPTIDKSSSPRGIDCFGNNSAVIDDAAVYSWMDAELDIGIGIDVAVDHLMIGTPVFDMEPSDKPVDLFEEDLYFLEHFINEISNSTV
ncbi:hypothetical protein CCR75_001443 [Bremia lactucae]|uniref:Uncharacterized protein n=1 Tax=Bremia lactucae TaxID=4779 RepID=A0A976IM79_BRELC|nr:hypothetical protein CCR75_001443 [Bremia lactucae]